MKGLESNMTILHSRFAEVRRSHAQTAEIKLSQINLSPKQDEESKEEAKVEV